MVTKWVDPIWHGRHREARSLSTRPRPMILRGEASRRRASRAGPCPAALARGRGDGIGTEEPDLASGGEDCSSRAEGHGLIERLARDGAIILGRVEHPIGMAKYQMRCLDPARHAAAGMRLAARRRDGAGTSTDQRSERRVNPRSAADAARARSRKCPAHPATSLSVTRVRAQRIGYCRPHRRRRPEKTSVLPG